MVDLPKVSPGDWIRVGKEGRVDAVVCTVFDELSPQGASIEVVYLDGNKAINEDVKWVGTHWDFAIEGPCGGYADKYSRLQLYVQILRAGRKWERENN
jgi:hypothetical protein